VAGDEVRVEVREEDAPDGEPGGLLVGEVRVDVRLRIDDARLPRGLVADEVRGM
jgi:hypothetical protein